MLTISIYNSINDKYIRACFKSITSLIDECMYIIDAIFPQLIHDVFHLFT